MKKKLSIQLATTFTTYIYTGLWVETPNHTQLGIGNYNPLHIAKSSDVNYFICVYANRVNSYVYKILSESDMEQYMSINSLEVWASKSIFGMTSKIQLQKQLDNYELGLQLK